MVFILVTEKIPMGIPWETSHGMGRDR